MVGWVGVAHFYKVIGSIPEVEEKALSIKYTCFAIPEVEQKALSIKNTCFARSALCTGNHRMIFMHYCQFVTVVVVLFIIVIILYLLLV